MSEDKTPVCIVCGQPIETDEETLFQNHDGDKTQECDACAREWFELCIGYDGD